MEELIYVGSVWTNNKNGNTYTVKDFMLNCTNAHDGEIYVKYVPTIKCENLPYCREWKEFREKFTLEVTGTLAAILQDEINKATMKRTKVYEAIDTERDYQDEMTAKKNRPDMIPDLHVGDTLAAIQYNLNKALVTWYADSVPHTATLAYLRKIAALCVKAGETYNMPQRD